MTGTKAIKPRKEMPRRAQRPPVRRLVIGHNVWVHLVLITAALLLSACGGPAGDPERGEALYRQQSIGDGAAPGCISCHSLEPGVVKVGPSHAEVGARAEQLVRDPDYRGEATTAAEYLRESILEPNAHVVEGFERGVMYQNFDQVLSEQQVADLVAFLLTQR